MTKSPNWDTPKTPPLTLANNTMPDLSGSPQIGDSVFGRLQDHYFEIIVEEVGDKFTTGKVNSIDPAVEEVDGITMGDTVILPDDKCCGITKN